MTSVIRNLEEQLARCELLAELPREARTELSSKVVPCSFSIGEVLCRSGESASSAYLVVSGRFRADAGGRVVGEVGRGELVGEVSLLTGEPRSATVTALRDSEVIELPGDVFTAVLAEHPACYQAVARRLVERLQRVLTEPDVRPRARVLTLLHDGRGPSIESLEEFAQLIGAGAVRIDNQQVDVGRLETTSDVVALLPGAADADLVEWAMTHSDRTLLFVDAESMPRPFDRERTGGPLDLVLVQPVSIECPSGTARWLRAVEPSDHHHVRHGESADLSRVERRLTNREQVLVLSGGGARGLAHAGLYRALVERSMPIDAVVGVSAGAVAAGVIGMQVPPDVAGERATALFGGDQSLIDLTVPTIAMASGARLNERLKRLFGEQRLLEDLWLPTAVVSTNLTTASTHLHQSGSLWRAVRASAAIPGVFPPVAEAFGLLVDGGIVDNLPVELVRRHHPGATVIASDVGRKMQLLPDDFPADAEVSGWTAVRSRVGRGDRVPGMLQILGQLTALGGAGGKADRGDMHLEFDLDDFGMFDFKKGAAIVAAGYEQCVSEIDAWTASQLNSTTPMEMA